MNSRDEKLKDLVVQKILNSYSGDMDIEFRCVFSEIMVNYKFDLLFIEQNAKILDWDLLSRNIKLDWCPELIDKYIEKWDWSSLSWNESINHTKELHNKFITKWCHFALIRTGKIALNKTFLLKNKRFLQDSINDLFKNLEYYPCLLDHKIISLYKNHLDWDKISAIELLINSKEFLTKFQTHLNWNIVSQNLNIKNDKLLIDVLHEFEDKFAWISLLYNPCCYSSEEVKAEFPDKMKNWWEEKRLEKFLFHQRMKEFEEEFEKDKGWLINEDFESKKFYPNGLFTCGEINEKDILSKLEKSKKKSLLKYSKKKDYISIKRCMEDLEFPWNDGLINLVIKSYGKKNFPEGYYWKLISQNKSLKLSYKFILENRKKIDWYYFSSNPSLKWNDSFILKFRNLIDWNSFSRNPSIRWNEDRLFTFKKYLDWGNICSRDDITWDVSMLTKLQKYLSWEVLLTNPAIQWSKEMILTNKSSWFKAFYSRNEENLFHIKVNWDLELLSEIEYWKSFTSSNSLDWLEYLIPKLTNDDIKKFISYFNISESNNEPCEVIKIQKIYRDNSVLDDSIKVIKAQCSIVDSELRVAFMEIFEKETDVVELRFGGIIYEGGLDSIWVDRFSTRSWAQKRGESFYSFDTNEYYDPDIEKEYLMNKEYDEENSGSNITDGQIEGDWEGIKPYLGY